MSERNTNPENKVIYNSPTKNYETPVRSALKSCNYNVREFLVKMEQLKKNRQNIENLKPKTNKMQSEGKENCEDYEVEAHDFL